MTRPYIRVDSERERERGKTLSWKKQKRPDICIEQSLVKYVVVPELALLLKLSYIKKLYVHELFVYYTLWGYKPTTTKLFLFYCPS